MQENGTAHFTTLMQFVEWVKQLVPGEYLFRGVPNETYGIQASAFRRPKSNRNFKKFVEINKSLVEDARLQGLDEKDGRELEDLEVLAELQHHGAATCLIDFSYSAQVALWFACGQDPKTSQDCNPPHGKVLAVRKDRAKFKKITPELLKKEIDYFLQDGEMARLYQWQPRHLNNRIIAQQSIFLFGHFQFEADEECIIQEDSKQDILTELQEVAGITEAMLFPDFDGFARLRSEGISYVQPDTSDYRERGSELYQRGEYEQAITYYDEAIAIDPDDAQAYFSRGLAKRENEQHEDAITDFDKAININPNNAESYHWRGIVKSQLSQHEDAIVDFDKAININPNNAESYHWRGVSKYVVGQYQDGYEDAIADFDTAVNLNPNDAKSYYWRGLANNDLGQFEDAIADFTDAISINPDHTAAYFSRGAAYYERGKAKGNLLQYEDAIADFDTAIRLERNDASLATYYYKRSLAKDLLGRVEETKDDLQTALRLATQVQDENLIHLIKTNLRNLSHQS